MDREQNHGILPNFSSDIWRFQAYWGMVAFGYFGIFGVLFNLYLLRLGYGAEFIGLVLGLGQLVWAVFALPAAWAGARIGLKTAMLLGQLITAAGSALVLTTEGLPENLRAPALLAIWMLSWVGVSLNVVNSTPYLMSISPESIRSTAFAYNSAVVGLMAFAGSLAAGPLPGFLGGLLGLPPDGPAAYRYALALAPAAYLLGTAVLLGARPASLPVDGEQKVGLAAAPVGLLMFFGALVLLQSSADGALRAFFNIYLNTSLGAGPEQIGALLGFAQLVPVGAALLTPWLIARWGLRAALMVASALAGGFMLLVAGVPTLTGAAVGLVGVLSMGAILNTSRAIFGQLLVAPRWRATISAVASIGLALAWGISAGLGGYASQVVGFRGLFLISALVVLASVGLLLARRTPEIDQ